MSILKIRPDKTLYNRYGEEHVYFRKVDIVCHTSGNGIWTNNKRKVVHKKLELIISDKYELGRWHPPQHSHSKSQSEIGQSGFVVAGSLKVYFSRKYWKTEKFGLIYTDKNWLNDFKIQLTKVAKNTLVPSTGIDYSEQGLQGDNFVDLDVGNSFVDWFFNNLYSEKEKMLSSFKN